MLRSVSSAMLCARKFMVGSMTVCRSNCWSCADANNARRFMGKSKSCPNMHTAQIVAPVARPWAVVPAQVRLRGVDDAYLLMVKLAWAVQRMSRGTSLAKLESRYSPRMADPPPALAAPPGLEFETAPILLAGHGSQKARELDFRPEARGHGVMGKK